MPRSPQPRPAGQRSPRNADDSGAVGSAAAARSAARELLEHEAVPVTVTVTGAEHAAHGYGSDSDARDVVGRDSDDASTDDESAGSPGFADGPGEFGRGHDGLESAPGDAVSVDTGAGGLLFEAAESRDASPMQRSALPADGFRAGTGRTGSALPTPQIRPHPPSMPTPQYRHAQVPAAGESRVSAADGASEADDGDGDDDDETQRTVTTAQTFTGTEATGYDSRVSSAAAVVSGGKSPLRTERPPRSTHLVGPSGLWQVKEDAVLPPGFTQSKKDGSIVPVVPRHAKAARLNQGPAAKRVAPATSPVKVVAASQSATRKGAGNAESASSSRLPSGSVALLPGGVPLFRMLKPEEQEALNMSESSGGDGGDSAESQQGGRKPLGQLLGARSARGIAVLDAGGGSTTVLRPRHKRGGPTGALRGGHPGWQHKSASLKRMTTMPPTMSNKVVREIIQHPGSPRTRKIAARAGQNRRLRSMLDAQDGRPTTSAAAVTPRLSHRTVRKSSEESGADASDGGDGASAAGSDAGGVRIVLQAGKKVPGTAIPKRYWLTEESPVYASAANDASFVHGQFRATVFPSKAPSNRVEVQFLGRVLDMMLEEVYEGTDMSAQGRLSPGIGELRKALTELRSGDTERSREVLAGFSGFGPRYSAEIGVWSVVFFELVRQVFVHCEQRGILLERVRVRMLQFLEWADARLSGMAVAAQEAHELHMKVVDELEEAREVFEQRLRMQEEDAEERVALLASDRNTYRNIWQAHRELSHEEKVRTEKALERLHVETRNVGVGVGSVEEGKSVATQTHMPRLYLQRSGALPGGLTLQRADNTVDEDTFGPHRVPFRLIRKQPLSHDIAQTASKRAAAAAAARHARRAVSVASGPDSDATGTPRFSDESSSRRMQRLMRGTGGPSTRSVLSRSESMASVSSSIAGRRVASSVSESEADDGQAWPTLVDATEREMVRVAPDDDRDDLVVLTKSELDFLIVAAIRRDRDLVHYAVEEAGTTAVLSGLSKLAHQRAREPFTEEEKGRYTDELEALVGAGARGEDGPEGVVGFGKVGRVCRKCGEQLGDEDFEEELRGEDDEDGVVSDDDEADPRNADESRLLLVVPLSKWRGTVVPPFWKSMLLDFKGKAKRMGMRTMIALAFQAYAAKIKVDEADRRDSGVVEEFPQFITHWMLRQYGARALVQKRLASLIVSLRDYRRREEPVATLFARFCGMSRRPLPIDCLTVMLRALDLAFHKNMPILNATADPGELPTLSVVGREAIEALKEVGKTVPNANVGAAERKLREVLNAAKEKYGGRGVKRYLPGHEHKLHEAPTGPTSPTATLQRVDSGKSDAPLVTLSEAKAAVVHISTDSVIRDIQLTSWVGMATRDGMVAGMAAKDEGVGVEEAIQTAAHVAASAFSELTDLDVTDAQRKVAREGGFSAGMRVIRMQGRHTLDRAIVIAAKVSARIVNITGGSTDLSAARIIQAAWRARNARRRMAEMKRALAVLLSLRIDVVDFCDVVVQMWEDARDSTLAQLERVFASCDTDGNGMLDYEEFLSLCDATAEMLTPDHVPRRPREKNLQKVFVELSSTAAEGKVTLEVFANFVQGRQEEIFLHPETDDTEEQRALGLNSSKAFLGAAAAAATASLNEDGGADDSPERKEAPRAGALSPGAGTVGSPSSKVDSPSMRHRVVSSKAATPRSPVRTNSKKKAAGGAGNVT